MKKVSLPYIDEYEDLLRRIDLGDQSINESIMQDFLEKNTALMPMPFLKNHQLHFNSFISKFKIGPWVSDIAYLTKSTIGWYVVLIELENPHKNIFKGGNDHAEFTSDFTHARQQIYDWKMYIDENKNDVKETLKRFRKPLEGNTIMFKYAIVMGRRYELINSEARRRTLAELEKEGLKILTYDTILSDCKRIRRMPMESIVLTMHNKDRFKIKYLPQHSDEECKIETQMFSYMKCEDIQLTDEQINMLKEDGYEIESWLKGELLTLNNRYTIEGYKKKFPNNPISQLI